jgi:predicted GNAT superfamily acetyltransferase
VGQDAVIRQFVQIRESFENVTIDELSDFIDAGDRVVLRQRYRGAGHGPDVELEFTTIATLRSGKYILIEFSCDHAEALELVGLSGQGAQSHA